jgi:hypothetical protein
MTQRTVPASGTSTPDAAGVDANPQTGKFPGVATKLSKPNNTANVSGLTIAGSSGPHPQQNQLSGTTLQNMLGTVDPDHAA